MLGIDAKMYRHFAIVTIALTAGVGLLADGEKRQAAAQGLEGAANDEPEKTSPKDAKLIVSNDRESAAPAMAGFYRSGVNEFGFQTKVDSSLLARGLRRGGSHMMPTAAELAALGMTADEFLELSPEERAELMHGVRQGQSPQQREVAIRNATNSSLSRSGGGKSADY